jgi:quercetin dioxygenase-like cupin family protein
VTMAGVERTGTMHGRFDELPGEEVYPGVVRRSFSSAHATVTSYSFAPGASFPLHRHPQEQITLVQAGEVEMSVGEAVEPLSAGDWSVTPPELEHGLRAGPDGAQVVAIVVPRRESADAYTVVR